MTSNLVLFEQARTAPAAVTMKYINRSLIFLAIVSWLPASGMVINFDDVTLGSENTAFLDGTPYAGLSWGAGPYDPYSGKVPGVWVVTSSNSWFNGIPAHSENNYAWANGGSDLKISSSHRFNLYQMWFGMTVTSLEELIKYGMRVEVEGYRDGQIVYTKSFLPSAPKTWELIAIGFLNVDKVILKAHGRSMFIDDIFLSFETPITIDIKPGSASNRFNQNGKGVIPVAIYGASSLDVTQINISSLNLQGLTIKMTGKGKHYLADYLDLNSDGYIDLIVHFEDSSGWIAAQGGYAALTGQLLDGTPIEGKDIIDIVP